MRLSVVLGEWLDRPIEADLDVAVAADRLGYHQVWIGEMAKLDAPAAAAHVVARTEQIEPCLGPLAVTVRSPVQIALAVATVASTGRRTHVALGTSSNVVARWHDRSRRGAADRLATAAHEVRSLFDGERVNGFRLRQPPAGTTVTVAAFGPRAVAAAQTADRMVLNMVTADTAARLAVQHSDTAVWLAASIDPTPGEREWMKLGYVGYLGAPGYGEMFAEAGFGELVAFARRGAGPREIAARIPDELLDAVALVGDEANVRRRIAEYADAGITEIGLVTPPLDLPSGRPTLEALAVTGPTS
jgi:probable F420-dependent oxidoreductase